MKAVRLHDRSGPAGVFFEDAPIPGPHPGDALVRVRATGITPAELTWSETYQNADGSSRIPSIPGHEICGVVEALAAGVDSVAVGDEVYGLTSFVRDGGAAQYVATPAADLAPKPATTDFVRSAAVPLSALTAWQAFFDHAKLSAGQCVLIHGGAGGVGTFAIQLARERGARVITTASAKNEQLVRSLGADVVIDYARARFEEEIADVDVVIDTIGGDTQARSFRVVRPGGLVISLAGPIPARLLESHDARGLFFVVEPNRAELVEIARRIDSGALEVIVGQVFPLGRARQAFELGASGHNRGKIVLAA